MNLINELCRCDKVLIKYMGNVKLYDEDFRILDRYRGYINIVKEYDLNMRASMILKSQLFKKDELKIFDSSGDYIVDILRQQVVDKYINKED